MTDLEIEQAVTKAGGGWDGDHWKFEDADLHPFVLGLLAAERERWREWLTEKANNKRKCYTQTQDGDQLAAAEAFDWAVRELAPNYGGNRP